jgi:hypothetical protein
MCATSSYFQNYNVSGEQNLVEDLVIESIRTYGVDLYYLPRTLVSYDSLHGTDDQSRYDKAYLVEFYVRNVEGFAGDGNFLSKFGLEIRDQITFTVARRTFDLEIGQPEGFARPREGDLLYFPFARKNYEIKFVDHLPVFYQFGALQMYDLKCELFEYSGETFETGIADIDGIYAGYSINANTVANTLQDNYDIQVYSNTNVLNFDELDPFSNGAY